MASNINTCGFGGNLARDAELRQTKSGASVLGFSIANNVYVNGKEYTNWIRVSFWGTRAEKLAPSLVKGTAVYVAGTLYQSEYEKDGKTYTNLELNAHTLEFTGKKGDSATAAPVSDGFDFDGGEPAVDTDDVPF